MSDMDGLKSRAVLLVGVGAAGEVLSNGRATALAFARAGARLALVDIDAAALKDCAASVRAEGAEAITAIADVTREDDIAAAVRAALDAYGQIDVAHFNVAMPQFGKVEKISPEEFDRVFAVNAKAALLMVKHVLPGMLKQSRGTITLVSSVSAVRHLGISSPLYDMSKAALSALTRHLAVQYGAKGVRTNTLMLGMLDTPLARGAIERAGKDRESVYETYCDMIPMRSLGRAEDVANAALFLASDRARYINGAELVVDGGLIQRAG